MLKRRHRVRAYIRSFFFLALSAALIHGQSLVSSNVETASRSISIDELAHLCQVSRGTEEDRPSVLVTLEKELDVFSPLLHIKLLLSALCNSLL